MSQEKALGPIETSAECVRKAIIYARSVQNMANAKGPRQPHLMVSRGEIAENVLIPGDPKRVELMAQHLEEPTKVAENRQFVSYTGSYKGIPVSVVSSGIGVPAMLITVEELSRVGANTLIRVGTTGGLHPDVRLGDLVVATGAIRTDGGTLAYAPACYPALYDPSVYLALVNECRNRGLKVTGGIVWTSEAYYAESADAANKWEALGAVSVEMECSGLFVLSSIKRIRAGAILVADGNLLLGTKKGEIEGGGAYDPRVIESIHAATEVALNALRSLNG